MAFVFVKITERNWLISRYFNHFEFFLAKNETVTMDIVCLVLIPILIDFEQNSLRG